MDVQEAKSRFCAPCCAFGDCDHCEGGDCACDHAPLPAAEPVEVVPRSEAEAAELLALRLYDLMRDDDAEHMTEDDVEFVLRLRDAHPREETQ